MQIYLVGGAVRDRLLGMPTQDRDWLVVGSTAADLMALGYVPVGKDFPVFLHPETHEEYALARTERKSGLGYTGFTFFADKSVRLEEDLSRRDLTINAMAMDASGKIIDPFQGQQDLQNGILRHVSEAFIEDPVRILRIARFAARFGFSVAPETLDLMKEMVANGEVNALVAERVWQEIAKGLMEKTPSLMFDVLRECGALAVLLPEVNDLFGVVQRADYHPEIDCGIHTMMVLDCSAKMALTLPERYAALCHDLGKARTKSSLLPKHHGHELAGEIPLKAINKRLNVPKACAQLALLVTTQHGIFHTVEKLRPATIVDTLQRSDAFRNPERFQAALNVCLADARGRKGFEQCDYPPLKMWQNYLSGCLKINIAQLIQSIEDKKDIAHTIRQERINIVREIQKTI